MMGSPTIFAGKVILYRGDLRSFAAMTGRHLYPAGREGVKKKVGGSPAAATSIVGVAESPRGVPIGAIIIGPVDDRLLDIDDLGLLSDRRLHLCDDCVGGASRLDRHDVVRRQ